MSDDVLSFEGIDVWRWHAASQRRVRLLRDVEWQVARGEHWALLGPNGAGKTTLLRIAAARSYPSSGRAFVLGRELGRTAVAPLHERIGYVESKLARRFAASAPAIEVVASGATGTLVVVASDDDTMRRAYELLDVLAASHVAGRAFGECSDGERMRILLGRALLAEPELLLLDEPTAGLDLPGREFLLGALARLASERPELTTVVVVHHVEDVPPSTTHALLVAGGRVVAAGPVEETLTGEALSRCFGLPVQVSRIGGRYAATVEGHPAA
jgi:iron complex transport system ATP-binding protein